MNADLWQNTEIWWSTTLSSLQDLTANSLVGSAFYWVLQWFEQSKKGERDALTMLLLNCLWSVHPAQQRCGSTQPMPAPEGSTQLMNGNRVQWMGGYQSALPETSTVHKVQLWNKAKLHGSMQNILLQNKNWRNEQQNGKIETHKYAVKQCFWKSLNAYFSSKKIHIYSALYIYSFIRSGLLWSWNSLIRNFYKYKNNINQSYKITANLKNPASKIMQTL